jgi:transcriptional regulator with XRE-family HTH domain
MNGQQEKYAFGDFPGRLKQLIEKTTGSQRQLASLSGLTPQAINTYLRPPGGNVRIPKGEELFKLARALGVTMEFLLTGRDEVGLQPYQESTARDRLLEEVADDLEKISRKLKKI